MWSISPLAGFLVLLFVLFFVAPRAAAPVAAFAALPLPMSVGIGMSMDDIARESNEVITDKLWIGDSDMSNDHAWLRRRGITHIIDASGIQRALPSPEGINVLRISVDDLPQARINKFFPQTTQFIRDALANRGKVLVNCHMGISRSATIVAAYLIAECGMTLDKALLRLSFARPIIRPNPGFMDQLREWERDRRGTV